MCLWNPWFSLVLWNILFMWLLTDRNVFFFLRKKKKDLIYKFLSPYYQLGSASRRPAMGMPLLTLTRQKRERNMPCLSHIPWCQNSLRCFPSIVLCSATSFEGCFSWSWMFITLSLGSPSLHPEKLGGLCSLGGPLLPQNLWELNYHCDLYPSIRSDYELAMHSGHWTPWQSLSVVLLHAHIHTHTHAHTQHDHKPCCHRKPG